MKTTIEVIVRPFNVPDFVAVDTALEIIRDDVKKPDQYRLSDLSPETLEALCEQFTKEVFTKAGKHRPPQPDRETCRKT